MTKISDLSALTGASVDAANDLVTVVDMSDTGAARNKKMTFAEFLIGLGAVPKAGGTMTGDLIVPAEVYGVGWNGSNEVPTKNDVYDKIETLTGTAPTESFIIACSDETTALTTGTAKVTFRMPYAFTVTAVYASLTTAQTSGSIFTVDINEAGTTILSTKLTIDNTEDDSATAATAAVISDASLAARAKITVDIDQVGDGTAKGLKVAIVGHQ